MTIYYHDNGTALAAAMNLNGAAALDVGCGRGELVTFMNRRGAHAIGLECSPAQIEAAKATSPDIDLREGVGEAMPFADTSFDLVVFMFSLHHVPIEAQGDALKEAARVLRPGGLLYVAEPLCEGSGFEIHKPVDDETVVRAAAQRALDSLPGAILTARPPSRYVTSYHYTSFDEFRDDTIRVGPERRDAFEREEARLRVLFEELGVTEEAGTRFDQPVRINQFLKPDARPV